MNRLTLVSLAALLAVAAGAMNATPPNPIVYDVVEATRHVVHVREDGDRDLAAGDHVDGGEVVRTGWWSTTDLEVSARAARFHIESRSRVRLSPDEPGVLLEIERGRLRAQFGPLDTEIERSVATPSAVLAVRGTHYGVSVDHRGITEVVVFEGVVEVRDRAAVEPPVRVMAGHAMRIRAGQPLDPPRPHGVDPVGWDRGRSMSSYGSGPGGPTASQGPSAAPGPGPASPPPRSGHGRG